MSTARGWAIYTECAACGAGEFESCRKKEGAKDRGSYNGLYMHRVRVADAVNDALGVECPKCGRPETIPCFISTEYTDVLGMSVMSLGTKNKVHKERASKARTKRKERREMSVKREAEAAIKTCRRSDWDTVHGGGFAVKDGYTVLKPPVDSKYPKTAFYVIAQESGRLFRSVTTGSAALTSCTLCTAAHSGWLAVAAKTVAGGSQLLAREEGRSGNGRSTPRAPTLTSQTSARTPEPEPEFSIMASFLTPSVQTKRVIVEERTHSLTLTLHDLTRLLTSAGVRVSPKKVTAIGDGGADVQFPLTLQWSDTTEKEETDG